LFIRLIVFAFVHGVGTRPKKRSHAAAADGHEVETRQSKRARSGSASAQAQAAASAAAAAAPAAASATTADPALDVLHGEPDDPKEEKGARRSPSASPPPLRSPPPCPRPPESLLHIALKLDPIENPEVNVDPETGLRVFLGPKIRIRDAGPKALEAAGELSWTCVANTGEREDLRRLMDLKDVVAKQLPNMPRDYITRLVLDLNHRSVIGVKGGKVIGGITFKCFDRPGRIKFIEIVFCAITADQQVQGYGSRLMSNMKVWAQKHGFEHMLTYADDFAIGYFQRQGFTLELELAREHWDIGFLKHYDSATLMHCQVDPKVDYLEISAHLHTQRSTFVKTIRELTRQHLIYPGLTFFKDRAKDPAKDARTRLALDHVPGLKEAGWDGAAMRALLASDEQGRIEAENRALLEQIKADQDSWPFSAPVSEIFPSEAPKYLQTIKDPIDLRTIEHRLDRGYYITHEMFVADLLRMVENCQEYNPKDSDYYLLAEGLRDRYLRSHVTEVDVPASPPK